jgi:HK97 family phage major capsid protein
MTPEEKKQFEAETRAKIEAEFKAKADAEARAKTAAEDAARNTPDAVLKREQERVSAIIAAGDQYATVGGPELARELIKDANASVETFKARMLDKMRGTSTPVKTAQPGGAAAGSGARVRYLYGKLQCFKDLPTDDGGTMKAEEAAYRSGMWLAAAIHSKPWAQKWCKENGIPMLARDNDGRVVDLEGFNLRAANENVLSAGGALVPVEMEASIIMLRDTYGVMRQLARSRPMNGDQLKIPRRKSGLTAYFFQDDDGVGLTESQKGWDNVTLSTKKLGALAKVSRDLVEDAVISVVDDLAQEMAYAFAVKEDQCYFIGDGTSTYGGIQGINPKFEATAYISRNSLTSGHNTFAGVDNTDLTTTMGQLAQYADTPEAVFVCSHLAKHQMFNRLKAVAGGNRVDSLGDRPDNQYLGYRILTSEAMPKITTSLNSKVMFLFGRFDLASSVGNRRGIEMLTLVERYAELGQIGLIATERFDLVVHDLGTTSTSDVNGGRGPIAAGFGN